MNEEQKNAILDVYDDLCDELTHISKLYVNLPLAYKVIVKRSLQRHPAPQGAHARIKKWVVARANNTILIPPVQGIEFIDNPGFEVETTLRGQDVPGSIENNVFITTLHEHYFELNDPEVVAPRFKGYLDKGLIKLALRIRKVEVAPGIYKLLEEVVPVYTTAYNEMLEKLINDFRLKYNRVPTAEALSLIKSKAMAAVCDREYFGGSIVKVDSMRNLESTKIDTVINNPDSRLVSNWSTFKREIERDYGITWEDIYYSRQGKKVSIWGSGIPTPFDNRALETEKTKVKSR